MKYKIGDWVKIKLKCSKYKWYHTNIMKIIDIIDSSYYETDYIEWEKEKYNRLVHGDWIYQDNECRNKYRKDKLRKILL